MKCASKCIKLNDDLEVSDQAEGSIEQAEFAASNQGLESTVRNTNNKNCFQSKIVAEAIPLESLHAIHRDISKYCRKWNNEETINLVDSSLWEKIFTFIQYFNRASSLVGPLLIITENDFVGWIVSVCFVYIEFSVLIIKERILKVEERTKNLASLKDETENLGSNYLELLEIVKPLHPCPRSPLGKKIENLKEKLNIIIKVDGEWGKLSPSNTEIKEKLRNPPPIPNSRPRFWKFYKLARGCLGFELAGKSDWKEKWRENKVIDKREEIIDLVSKLQTTISEYRQGFSYNESSKEEQTMVENDQILEL